MRAPGEQQMNGLIYYLSHVTLAGVTDGTSNTFAFAERGHGRFPASDVNCWNWWTSGNYGDTMFNTFYGINVWQKPPFNVTRGPVCYQNTGPDEFVSSIGSFHPGGANVGFLDGSVKFIKDAISSWQINPSSIGTPGTPRSPACLTVSRPELVPIRKVIRLRWERQSAFSSSFQPATVAKCVSADSY